MEQFWIITGNIALYFAALVTTVLVCVYGVFTQWERTQVGRQFMLTILSLAAAIDLGALLLLVSSRPQVYMPLTPLRAFVYGGIGLIMLRWLVIVITTQRGARRKKHPVWDAPEEPPPVRRES